MTCTNFDLQAQDPDRLCRNQYLDIRDARYGRQRFCGKNAPKNVRAMDGQRDVFVSFYNAFHQAPAQFNCSAECTSGPHGKKCQKNLKNYIFYIQNGRFF